MKVKATRALRRAINFARFGRVTSKVVGWIDGYQPCEIEYYDYLGRVIGYWAYGHFDPSYPYRED